MATDFAAEGLLDDLEGEASAQRLELLEGLEAAGFSLTDVRRAHEDDSLPLLLAEQAVRGVPRYTAQQISEHTGLPIAALVAVRRALGLPIPELGAVAYSETELEAARLVGRFTAAGVTPEQQLVVVRVLGQGLAQTAEAMRATVLELVLDPEATELELARRYAAQVEALMPLLAPTLEVMLRIHLRHAVRTEAMTATERLRGVAPGAQEVTIAFADLVGFTRLGESVPADELGRVAERLGELTREQLRGDVRLIKSIGDAVMFAGADPEAVVAVALDVVAAADAEGPAFPQLRVGVTSGPASRRAGDLYGQPVNLASRVTAIARPGSVVTTREVHDRTPDAFAWSAIGRRTVKGVDRPVTLFRARALAAEPA